MNALENEIPRTDLILKDFGIYLIPAGDIEK